MKEYCINVNLNNILFNIYCKNEYDYEQVKYVFEKMLAPDWHLKSNLNNAINIYYLNDANEYHNMGNSLKNIKPKMKKPNILEYDLNDIKIYHHYTNFWVYKKDNDYYMVSNNNKYAPYYLILELYLKQSEIYNYYLFHGNGIKIENNSIDIIGNSNSGKTTLTSKLFELTNHNKSFLSNDRILIGKDQTLYFPIDVSLDARIIANDNCLNKELDAANNQYISPNRFINIYDDLSYISNTNNNCFIVPQIDLKHPNSIEIDSMDSNNARRLLTNCCFSIEDKESFREKWIINGKNEEEIKKEISILINYIINYYKIIYLKYGYKTEGEEIYERIRKKI